MLAILEAAGWPIWPLVACSVVALALVIERSWALRTKRVVPAALLDEVLLLTRHSLPAPEVLERLASHSELGSVLANGLRAATVDPRGGEPALRQAFEGAGRASVHRLERYLDALGTIASAAPLLGLLGTVVGMIEIFGAQAPGSGNPQQLAHGISIALYNTAFGLIVAIPALMFHRYFRARVAAHSLQLELSAERLLAHLLRHAARRAA